jgi:hypothetical protein
LKYFPNLFLKRQKYLSFNDYFLRWIAASALAVSGLGIAAITWIAVKERTHKFGTSRALRLATFSFR